MGTYDSIATGIINILNTVTELNGVFDGEKKTLGKYPSVTVSALSHSNVFHSTNSNKREFGFILRFYFRTDDANNPDFETVLRKAVDASITALERDVTLGGVCDYSTPSTGKWGYGEKESPVRVCEVTMIPVAHIVR